jgi:hypothetical protein
VKQKSWPEGVLQQIEVVQVSPATGLIVVPPSRSLATISWLKLIEIAPYRFLLAVPTGTAPESLEIAILDLLEHLPEDDYQEKTILADLRQKLSQHRQMEGLTKAEILLITHDSRSEKVR